MKKKPDVVLSRILILICVSIVGYWIWNGLNWLWDWYRSVSELTDTSVWTEIWLFIVENLSVIALIYGIICLQVSGLAELKFGKNFLKAFILAICLTPPIMMGIYGHKKESLSV